MTPEEFNSEFDVFYNSISSNQAPGLNAYEKSVFLTKAQDDIVISLYTGRELKGQSFEETEELRANLRDLIKTTELEEITPLQYKLSDSSKFFSLPSDVLYITYESALVTDKCNNSKEIEVIPVTQDSYHRIKKNPFKWANERRALKLDAGNRTIEIISKYNVNKYKLRYLSKPTPIIIEDLPEGYTIGDLKFKTPCMLDSSIHRMILERAVLSAMVSMQTNK